MTASALSTSVVSKEDRELLDKAQEIAELFQRAVRLGYSISMSPEQMSTVVAILECAELVKLEKKSE